MPDFARCASPRLAAHCELPPVEAADPRPDECARHAQPVMAGLVPAIHAMLVGSRWLCPCADGRHKAGHDEYFLDWTRHPLGLDPKQRRPRVPDFATTGLTFLAARGASSGMDLHRLERHARGRTTPEQFPLSR